MLLKIFLCIFISSTYQSGPEFRPVAQSFKSKPSTNKTYENFVDGGQIYEHSVSEIPDILERLLEDRNVKAVSRLLSLYPDKCRSTMWTLQVASYGDTAMMELLLNRREKYPADLDYLDPAVMGGHIFLVAASEGHLDIIKLLLERKTLKPDFYSNLKLNYTNAIKAAELGLQRFKDNFEINEAIKKYLDEFFGSVQELSSQKVVKLIQINIAILKKYPVFNTFEGQLIKILSDIVSEREWEASRCNVITAANWRAPVYTEPESISYRPFAKRYISIYNQICAEAPAKIDSFEKTIKFLKENEQL